MAGHPDDWACVVDLARWGKGGKVPRIGKSFPNPIDNAEPKLQDFLPVQPPAQLSLLPLPPGKKWIEDRRGVKQNGRGTVPILSESARKNGAVPFSEAVVLQALNRAETESELRSLRRSAWSGTPFGETTWVQRTAKRLGLASTLRSLERPPSMRQA
jgi:hypothetical protein